MLKILTFLGSKIKSVPRETVEKVIVISILTTVMGQIYISPVAGVFRLSMAVFILSLLLIFLKQVPVIVVCCIIAALTPFFRTLVHFITYRDMTFFQTLSYYLPVSIYYVLYGILFKSLKIDQKLSNPLLLIISLWFCDSIPNIAEALFRSLTESMDFDRAVLNIILAGLIRTIVTYFLYCISNYYKERYNRRQKEHKYREMALFISSLKSELFFLRKSMTDIEATMRLSYELYRGQTDKALKERLLTISTNIHEIKKDYYRVVNGMEKALAGGSERTSMNLKEIFDIVAENSRKIIAVNNKNIELDFRLKDNFKTRDFYSLITVLNNFIINSIDAIDAAGAINIEQFSKKDYYIFKVTDNGSGIGDEEMDLLFEPGFSTKYNPVTGQMSTGIGLSHVKQIVENYFNGKIRVQSSKSERRTSFEAVIPARKLICRDRESPRVNHRVKVIRARK